MPKQTNRCASANSTPSDFDYITANGELREKQAHHRNETITAGYFKHNLVRSNLDPKALTLPAVPPVPSPSLSVTGYQRLHSGLIPLAFLELSEADKWNTVCLSQCGYCFLHCNAAQVLQARKEMHWQKRDKGTCEGKNAMESWGEEVRQRTPLAPEGAAGPLAFPQDSQHISRYHMVWGWTSCSSKGWKRRRKRLRMERIIASLFCFFSPCAPGINFTPP